MGSAWRQRFAGHGEASIRELSISAKPLTGSLPAREELPSGRTSNLWLGGAQCYQPWRRPSCGTGLATVNCHLNTPVQKPLL
jgi:hypothetical protein